MYIDTPALNVLSVQTRGQEGQERLMLGTVLLERAPCSLFPVCSTWPCFPFPPCVLVGVISGPFSNQEMAEWFQAGYFTMSLLVKRACDDTFQPLGDIMKMWGRVPFTPGPAPLPHLVIMWQLQYSNCPVANGNGTVCMSVALSWNCKCSSTKLEPCCSITFLRWEKTLSLRMFVLPCVWLEGLTLWYVQALSVSQSPY